MAGFCGLRLARHFRKEDYINVHKAVIAKSVDHKIANNLLWTIKGEKLSSEMLCNKFLGRIWDEKGVKIKQVSSK